MPTEPNKPDYLILAIDERVSLHILHYLQEELERQYGKKAVDTIDDNDGIFTILFHKDGFPPINALYGQSQDWLDLMERIRRGEQPF